MRRSLPAAALILWSSTAVAGPPVYLFHIPAGPLKSALVSIGGTAGVTIGITDQLLANTPLPPLDGRFNVPRALRRLLAGTDAGFVQRDDETFQIVRRNHPLAAGAAPRPAAAPVTDATILVTGSKRAVLFQDYPATVDVVDTAALRPNRIGHGSDALVEQLPILASTHLGPGRDKLFIRGIADSSFAGPTQATVGQYLGDVRLNYNAPDPDLALYDIRSVEVLEGPQGTLYGAGSLGGIVRLEPEPPDLSRRLLTISAGAALTAHGAPSGDAAIVANLPLVDGTLALRAVGYGGFDGGYVDDLLRGRRDINRTFTRGLRATLRWRPRGDWTIEVGGVVQDINSHDGQYAERGMPPLTRASVLAQPFDNDYALADVVVRYDVGVTSLVSASSFVGHNLDTVYDASVSTATPLRYEGEDAITIWTNETHLSHRDARGRSWVVGFELLRSEDRLARQLGPPGAQSPISGTRNVVEEGSLFGEATLPLVRGWSVTGGARVDYARQVGEVLDQPSPHREEPNRHVVSALPSLALLWKPAARLSLYGRYQEGYRPGGLSVQANDTQRFEADSLATWEAGARFGTAADRFSATFALSYAHWEDIQADLVDTSGLPYTANIGSGRVTGAELRAIWRPVDRLRLEGALFADRSRLTHPAPAFAGERDASLPNIPGFLGRAAAAYRLEVAGRPVDLTASVRYVGRSRLGVGPTLDLAQGPYVDTSAGGSVRLGRITASLDATNLLDRRGNVFALGNPFGVMAGRQVTPLRPRTIRLGSTIPF